MASLRVYLFRSLRITWDEVALPDLGSPTTRSLLAYLLMHRQTPTDRRRLAFLFWPRGTESAARRNLRQYLHHIRQVLEPIPFDGDLLLSDGSSVQFNPHADIWLDVEAFRHNTLASASLEQLQQAETLYTGDLLEDLYEDWSREAREQLRRIYLDTLKRLSNQLPLVGASDQAVYYAQKWVQADPLDESAHQCLMRLYAQQGRRNHAIQHYQHFAETLKRELGVEPLPETQALALAIQTNTPPPQSTETVSPPPPLSPLSLIGRDDELAILEAIRQQGENLKGHVVLISGEPGIGKTRLAQEYLQCHADLPILQSVCHELKTLMPYASLHQILSDAVKKIPAEMLGALDTWQDVLLALSPQSTVQVSEDEHQHSHDLFSAEKLGELILQLCRHIPARPLHLLFDNLHWCDSPTWQVLAYLAPRILDQPLVIIGLCRMEDLSPDRRQMIRAWERNQLLTHISLRRLSAEETRALVQQLPTRRPVDDLFVQRLYQETEGNPLFIVETLRAMQEASFPHKPLSFSSQIPLSIQQVIEARLDLLTPEGKELLAQAAAIGREFSFTLLQVVSQQPAEVIIPHIEKWLRRGLVREWQDGYDFTHEKIRQVAQAQLSQARRQYTHRRIAEALEQTVPPANAVTLAHHYARSDQPLKALPYLTRAGEQALRVRSYREARQFGLHAMSLLGRMPGPRQQEGRLELNLQLAQIYAFTGNIAQAREILVESEHLAFSLGNPTQQTRLHRRLAQIYWLSGQPEEAADYARRTLRSASEQDDRRNTLAALRMLGRTSIAQSAFDDAVAYFQRYIRMQSEGVKASPDLPVIYGYLGVAYSRVGSWELALGAARQGVALAEAQGNGQNIHFARMQEAFILAGLQDWEACRRALRQLPPPGELEQDLTPLGFMTLSVRGYATGMGPSRREGVAMLRRALAWAEAHQHRIFHYLPRIFLARVLLRDGQTEAADKAARQALADAQRSGDRWAAGVTLQLLGEIGAQSVAPQWPQVESYLIESMYILRRIRARPDLARTFLALRRLYDRAGQMAWAVDCHFRATTIFEELGMRKELRLAQGQAGGQGQSHPLIPDSGLRGPNAPQADSH